MARPSWIAALWVTLLVQTVASFLTQSLPAIAPLMTADAGLRPEVIGNLASVIALGTVLFLLAGNGVLARFGPVRTLQIGAAVLALGMLIAASGSVPALVFASLLLGIGYAPAAPAGSQILQDSAPAEHRTLIFSVKQAGAPLGGAFAGLICAPVAAWLGWQAALLLGAAVAIATGCIIQPQRRPIDRPEEPRPTGAAKGLAQMLAAPIAALRLDARLPPLIALAMSFSVVQGCLFTFVVTWLVTDRGLSLVEAGGVFAAMQAAGVLARIVLGWLADRTGRPGRNLLIQAIAAAACTLLLTLLPAGLWLLVILAGATGSLAASWNGIVMAEVARLVPRGRVGDATAGCALLIFLGYLVGPSAFALLIGATGSWGGSFAVIAGQLVIVAGAVAAPLLRSATVAPAPTSD
ncbi:MFS transporter [Roseomonas terrae]|jgi:MFS family permease|uniref:MFS transporter n=1 Tax=Neoroseomonas terrae TaxID=424799 RepID=A0ABS5EGE4_9PROT|nr:MFS transporter [Neoroseomonas terrae]MBR0650092.1 MFS transporter [Neoroseomonas terrae]